MVNPIFDTGVFLLMLILSLVLFFASAKTGTLLLLPAAAMLLILGIVLVTGYDVVNYRLTTDNVSLTLNETNYFIKNTYTSGSTQWMGWVFLVLGLMAVGKFLMDITDKDKKIL